MIFSASEWTSFPDQDPKTSDNIKISDTFLSKFNMNNCELVGQFLDDGFDKGEIFTKELSVGSIEERDSQRSSLWTQVCDRFDPDNFQGLLHFH